MAEPISNRLQVDLKILADKQFEFLQEFADRWDNSIIALEKIVDKFQAGIGGEARPSGASATASTGAQIRRPSHSGVNIGDLLEASISDFVQTGPSKGASIAGRLWNRPNQAFNSKTMTKYEQAAFRTGLIPRGMAGGLQYGSYIASELGRANMANKLGWAGRRAVEAEGLWGIANRLPVIGSLARSTGSLASSITRGAHMVSPTMPMMGEMSQYGTGAGYSPSGLLGTQYGSEAWRHGVRSNWEAYKRGSWLSIPGTNVPILENPRYSREQAKATENAIKQYGWSARPMSMDQVRQGDPNDPLVRDALTANMGQGLLRSELKHYTEKYDGIVTQDELMQMYDPVMRGQADLEDVRQTLDGLGSSAKAANMDLEVFKMQLDSVSTSLSKSTGMTKSQASKQLIGLAAATGLGPEQLEPIMSNQRNYWMARQTTGMSAWDLATSDEGATAIYNADTDFMSSMIGSPEEWQRAQTAADNGDPRELNRLRNDAAELQHMNPELFGNMPIESFIDQRWMRDPEDQARKAQAATDARGATSEAELIRAMEAGGATEEQIRQLDELGDLKGWDMQERSAKGADMLGAIYKAYNTEKGLEQGTDSEYMITVDPKYARFFKLIEQQAAEGGSFGKGNSNSKKFFAGVSSGVNYLKPGGGLDQSLKGLID